MKGPVTPAAYLDKANRALSGAHTLLQTGDTEGACNRAYYAMFDAAHAALWAAGGRQNGAVIKTHNGLVAAFGECMVKTGKISPEQGRAFANVLKTRLLADYTAEIPSLEEAQETITRAEAFVQAMIAFVAAL
jgi:uncharacterized protein (UPF0332 family)